MAIEASKRYEVVLPPYLNQMDVISSPAEDASDKFKAKYLKWGEINGEIVFVLSIKPQLYGWGEDQAKVYCVKDDYTEWFRITIGALQELAAKAPAKKCSCDLTLLMNRGCQCGAASD